MKITRIEIDNRRKQLVISAGRRQFAYPFALIGKGVAITHAAADREAGNEAFFCRTADGAEITIHLDDVRAQTGDMEYAREALLYSLTLQAQQQLEKRGLSKRALARLLSTSPAQVYRLLDQTCCTKTIDQMVRLLGALGCKVELHIAA